MGKTLENNDYRASLQRAILKLNEMQNKLTTAEKASSEPIAIIGMACHFPGGANDTDTFWQLLKEGHDIITEIPPERWNIDDYYDPDPDAPGKMSTRWGGFLKQVDQFDANFFGISPSEAACMDPQQRLLLETAWEALEMAGEVPDKLAGSQTGVFVGMYGNDYSLLQFHSATTIGTYTGTGTSHNIAAGRLSYLLDLRGPSVALDTACSSSLVAVHQACQSLRNKECQMALAAGVNLLLSPHFLIATSKMHMLAADGRCKIFDATANGTVFSEGCGVVVLKRFSDALAAGDPILALIRGSAVNQDGRSASLTAPNPLAQRDVIQKALSNAKINAQDISHIETHGMGTVLGDPIEYEALASVFGDTAQTGACYLGSLKTNLGHLGAASGIAGLIKTVLMLHHKEIPPLLHLQTLNPTIHLEDTPFLIPTECIDWTPPSKQYYASVSSFGWSGTNAHMILQEAPTLSTVVDKPSRQVAGVETRAVLLPLSARSQGALQQMAHDIIPFLQQVDRHGYTLSDVCYTACQRRSHHAHRLALVGHSAAELVEQAQTFLLREAVSTGFPEPGPPSVVFVFSGLDSIWAEVARRLLAQEPFFASQIQHWDRLLTLLTDWSLLSLLTEHLESESRHPLARPEVVLFALQMSLAALWQHWGIRPAAVIGHSVGEVAAAVVAGLLSAQDGLRLVIGREGPLQTLHTEHLGFLQPQEGALPLFSTLTSYQLPASYLDEDYWSQQMHEPVHFTQALSNATAQGYRCFLQLGGDPTLLPAIEEHLKREGLYGLALSTFRKTRGRETTPPDEQAELLRNLGALYTYGADPSWEVLQLWLATPAPRLVPFPRYPWQQQRYWIDINRQQSPRTKGTSNKSHQLLGRRLRSALKEIQFETSFSTTTPDLLQDHRIKGAADAPIVVSGSSYMSMALSAVHEVFGTSACLLEDIYFPQALVVLEDSKQTVQLIISPESAEQFTFQICSQEESRQDTWIVHATGKLIPRGSGLHGRMQQAEHNVIQARCHEELEGSQFYTDFWRVGYHLGPDFRWIDHIWRRDGEALCKMHLPQNADEGSGYQLHPGLIDSCIQALFTSLPHGGITHFASDNVLYIPLSINQFYFYTQPHGQVWCHALLQERDDPYAEVFIGNLRFFDATEQVIADVEGLTLKRVHLAKLLQKSAERVNSHHLQEGMVTHIQERSLRDSLLAIAAGSQRRHFLETHLCEQIGQVLGMRPEEIDPDRPLGNPTIDSLLALEISSRLKFTLGLDLPATLVWNYPTILLLTSYVAKKLNITLEEAPTDVQPQNDAADDAVTVFDPELEISTVRSIIEDIEGLSDEDIQKLFLD